MNNYGRPCQGSYSGFLELRWIGFYHGRMSRRLFTSLALLIALLFQAVVPAFGFSSERRGMSSSEMMAMADEHCAEQMPSLDPAADADLHHQMACDECCHSAMHCGASCGQLPLMAFALSLSLPSDAERWLPPAGRQLPQSAPIPLLRPPILA
ncbi:hypothetical protein G7Y82_11660 [Solimonas sp. C16B3]|uniref:Uncharacterized protein n=2 Tax=Solimonas marina TaxID=2714601 RepID=A0A969W9S5_9GAMM|nr:hypothetical protein [Solimonas marina]